MTEDSPDLTHAQEGALLWAHYVWLAGFAAGRQAALDDPIGSLERDPAEISPYKIKES